MVRNKGHPGGLPIEVFDDVRAQLAANRGQFYYELASGPFYSFNREGAKRVETVVQNWWQFNGDDDILHDFRRIWAQALILNRSDRPREGIEKDIAFRLADLESYGAMVLVNPDFTERISIGAPPNTADDSVYFGEGPEGLASGYTDFPALADSGKSKSDRFQAIVRLKIRPGKLEEFKRIAADRIRLAQEKDTGNIRYDIFLDDNETEAVVYEEFVNPVALLEHVANLGEKVAGMLAVVDMQVEV